MIGEEDSIIEPIRLTRAGRTTLLISLLFLVVGSFSGSLLLVFLTSFWLIYLATASQTSMKNIRPIVARLEVHNSSIHQGELISIRAEITNRSPSSRIIDITLNSSNNLYAIEGRTKARLKIGALENKQLTFHLISLHRGEAEVGPLVISQRDSIGLLQRKIYETEKISLRVFPRRVGTAVPTAYRREVISRLIGLFAMRIKGFGTEFYGLRDYVRGDPIKAIDWKATARTRKLITREYEDEKRLTVVLALDISHSMAGEKFNFALTTIQDLVQTIIEIGHSCAVVVFADKIISYFPPSDSPRFAYQIWQSFFKLAPLDVKADYSTITRLIYSEHYTRSLVIFISDAEQDLELKEREIRNIRMRENHVILMDLWGYPLEYERFLGHAVIEAEDPQQVALLAEHIHPYALISHAELAEKARKSLGRSGAKYTAITSAKTSPFHALEALIKQEMMRISH